MCLWDGKLSHPPQRQCAHIPLSAVGYVPRHLNVDLLLLCRSHRGLHWQPRGKDVSAAVSVDQWQFADRTTCLTDLPKRWAINSLQNT